jgi:hypothetical protein
MVANVQKRDGCNNIRKYDSLRIKIPQLEQINYLKSQGYQLMEKKLNLKSVHVSIISLYIFPLILRGRMSQGNKTRASINI